MRIEGSNSALTNLRNAPKVSSGSTGQADSARKSLGETPPVRVPAELLGELAELFAPGGMLSKLRRRLNRLKNKKCKLVPAKGTVACINEDDEVFVGIEFLREFKDREDGEEVIAGVLAHEWGHACAERPQEEDVQKLNWNEIFELRKAHETLADEISGRLLALMGYKPDGLINFLTRGEDTHNLKYHPSTLRAQIVRKGFEEEKRKMNFAKDLFAKSFYSNNYTTRLIDDDI